MSEVQGPGLHASLPIVTRLWIEAAERCGIDAEIIDGEFGYLFALSRGAQRRILIGGRSPLNDAVSARLADDKHYTGLVLGRAGVRVPQTARCLSPRATTLQQFRDRAGLDAGVELAERVGYPIIVKPNHLSHGRGVKLVEERGRLGAAVRETWELDGIALVQERIDGRDFRLDFLGDSFLIGYERRPLRVRGDGRRSLTDLLIEKDPRLADAGRRRRLAEEPRFREMLETRGWTLGSVLKEGASLSFEGPIQNLNGASTARLVQQIPEGLRAMCANIGRRLGLRHYGIDLKAETLEAEPGAATVIEVNSSPVLAQIYLLGYREPALAAQMRLVAAIFGEP